MGALAIICFALAGMAGVFALYARRMAHRDWSRTEMIRRILADAERKEKNEG